MWPTTSQWKSVKEDVIDYLNSLSIMDRLFGSKQDVLPTITAIHRLSSMTSDPEAETFHIEFDDGTKKSIEASSMRVLLNDWVPNDWNKPAMSCMWCAAEFQTIDELEAHEDSCS